MNGTIQKKKDSRSDFQGLLFVFEYVVVIISSQLLKRRFTHYIVLRQTFIVMEFQSRELRIMPVQFDSLHPPIQYMRT